MDENAFTRLETSTADQICPNRKKGLRNGRAGRKIKASGQRQAMASVCAAEFRVAPTGGQSTDLISDFPRGDVCADDNYSTGHFQPKNRRGSGRWGIVPRT